MTFSKVGANKRVDPSDFISGVDDQELQLAMEATRGADAYDLLDCDVGEVRVDDDVVRIDIVREGGARAVRNVKDVLERRSDLGSGVLGLGGAQRRSGSVLSVFHEDLGKD